VKFAAYIERKQDSHIDYAVKIHILFYSSFIIKRILFREKMYFYESNNYTKMCYFLVSQKFLLYLSFTKIYIHVKLIFTKL